VESSDHYKNGAQLKSQMSRVLKIHIYMKWYKKVFWILVVLILLEIFFEQAHGLQTIGDIYKYIRLCIIIILIYSLVRFMIGLFHNKNKGTN